MGVLGHVVVLEVIEHRDRVGVLSHRGHVEVMGSVVVPIHRICMDVMGHRGRVEVMGHRVRAVHVVLPVAEDYPIVDLRCRGILI